MPLKTEPFIDMEKPCILKAIRGFGTRKTQRKMLLNYTMGHLVHSLFYYYLLYLFIILCVTEQKDISSSGALICLIYLCQCVYFRKLEKTLK